MIKLEKKEDCCGCYACMACCPVSCIEMQEDNEGFLYPVVDRDKCVECSMCQKVCPTISRQVPRKPLNVYACKNKSSEVRCKSSSGGVFSLLAEQTIAEGGTVFGACFNEKNKVIHSYTSTREGLELFRGSKYVQSEVGDTYRIAEKILKSGRFVLFSGSPCQILGLRLYLKKDYSNLLTVDFICHGVPSPKVWNIYLKELSQKHSLCGITNINFRNKELGWSNFCFSLDFTRKKHTIHLLEPMYLNHYMRGFLSDLYLRPSCYQCPVRYLKSGSDITLGDYWGDINALGDFVDDKGISAVFLNTPSGINYFNSLTCEVQLSSYEEVLVGNKSVEKSNQEPIKRKQFYSLLEHRCFFSIIEELTEMSFKERMKLKIMNLHIMLEKLKMIY